VQWAKQLGWPAERVVVVDEDQGKSGAQANARSGFGRVVTSVGRGEVGIVMSLEASRLARNSPDWHNLIYMCRYTNTIIGDENGIYDPTSSTDRMVLGIRGPAHLAAWPYIRWTRADGEVYPEAAVGWSERSRGVRLIA